MTGMKISNLLSHNFVQIFCLLFLCDAIDTIMRLWDLFFFQVFFVKMGQFFQHSNNENRTTNPCVFQYSSEHISEAQALCGHCVSTSGSFYFLLCFDFFIKKNKKPRKDEPFGAASGNQSISPISPKNIFPFRSEVIERTF